MHQLSAFSTPASVITNSTSASVFYCKEIKYGWLEVKHDLQLFGNFHFTQGLSSILVGGVSYILTNSFIIGFICLA